MTIKYGCFCYSDGDLDRDYEFKTLDEAKEKFNEIKKEGVYSYFWGDVDYVDLVKFEDNDDDCKILKVLDTLNLECGFYETIKEVEEN